MILEAFVCSENFGNIQLETVMQSLAVLAYIDLMQCTALISYCSVSNNDVHVAYLGAIQL